MINFTKACAVGAVLAALVVGGAQAADSVVVSSKIDTEGNLLGNVIAQVLQAHGVPVTNKVSLGATPIVRKAIVAGEIDIYPEYTGNAAFFFNKADDPVWKDAAKGYEAAKKLDYDANKIVWLTPAPANNTWAIGLLGTVADANKLASLSDFGKWVSGGGKVKLAASSEFVNSAAALPAFQKAYGFTLKPDQLLVLSGGDTSATIKAAAEQTDGVNAAMVYGTDGAHRRRRPRRARRRQRRAAGLRSDADRARGRLEGASGDRRHSQARLRQLRPQNAADAERPHSGQRRSGQGCRRRLSEIERLREIMSGAGEASPVSGAAPWASFVAPKVDKLGVVIALLAGFSLFFEPLATFRANRIVSGKGLAHFRCVAGEPGGLRRRRDRRRERHRAVQDEAGASLRGGRAALIALALLVGYVPGHVIPSGNALARVAPAAGFWVMVFAFAILVTDAVAKLAFGPIVRVAILAAAAAIVGGDPRFRVLERAFRHEGICHARRRLLAGGRPPCRTCAELAGRGCRRRPAARGRLSAACPRCAASRCRS